jgi:hypothetical protein
MAVPVPEDIAGSRAEGVEAARGIEPLYRALQALA